MKDLLLIMVALTSPFWIPVAIVVSFIFLCAVNDVPQEWDSAAYYYGAIKSQLEGESVTGSHIIDYNPSTKELTIALRNGKSKTYEVKRMPATVENEGVIDNKLLSNLYMCIFKEGMYGIYKIVDWDENSGLLTLKSEGGLITFKDGIDGFYLLENRE